MVEMKSAIHTMEVSSPSTAEKREAGNIVDFGRRAGKDRILNLVLGHVDSVVPAG